MRKLTCIIVEDEPLAMARLKTYVLRHASLTLLGTFDQAQKALSFLATHPADLVLADIQMEGMNGLSLAERLKQGCQVIFSTAFPEHAVQGFDLDVTDYLLKPYSYPRFEEAIAKAVRQFDRMQVNDGAAFFVPTEYRLERIAYKDLKYIEGKRDYRKIHTVSKMVMTLKTFREFEAELDSGLVCRVHKSFMISLEKVTGVGNGTVYLGQEEIPVSGSYRDELLHRLRAE